MRRLILSIPVVFIPNMVSARCGDTVLPKRTRRIVASDNEARVMLSETLPIGALSNMIYSKLFRSELHKYSRT